MKFPFLLLFLLFIPLAAKADNKVEPSLTWRDWVLNAETPSEDLTTEAQQLIQKNTPLAWGQLAYLYRYGKGVPTDYGEAYIYSRRAADAGLAFGYYLLGHLYGNGLGVTENQTDSFYYDRLGAEAGDPYAQNNLGVDYLDGLGVKTDPHKAKHWFEVSASSGNAMAYSNLGSTYLRNFPELKRNAQKAEEYLLKAIDQGIYGAAYKLGYMYLKGNGIKPDFDKAYKFLLIDGKKGNSNAQFELGNLFSGSKYSKEALEWYTQAAHQGHKEARWRGANVAYDNGNLKSSIELLLPPAQKGEARAQFGLGTAMLALIKTQVSPNPSDNVSQHMLYELHHAMVENQLIRAGYELSYKGAAFWLKKAVEQNYLQANLMLAQMYDNGRFKEVTPLQSLIKAGALYRAVCKSQAEGDATAKACSLAEHRELKSKALAARKAGSNDWVYATKSSSSSKFYYYTPSITQVGELTFVVIRENLIGTKNSSSLSGKPYNQSQQGWLLDCNAKQMGRLFTAELYNGDVISENDFYQFWNQMRLFEDIKSGYVSYEIMKKVCRSR